MLPLTGGEANPLQGCPRLLVQRCLVLTAGSNTSQLLRVGVTTSSTNEGLADCVDDFTQSRTRVRLEINRDDVV